MFDPSSYRYKSRRPDQAAMEKRIKEICETRVRYGYRRIHTLLQREGWTVNHKRVRRIYNELGLQLRIQATRLIREYEASRGIAKRTVIVGVTAYIHIDYDGLIYAGMDHVMSKPITIHKLISLMRDYLN